MSNLQKTGTLPWIKGYVKTPHHPKVENLSDALDICVAHVIGHLFMLWWWAVQYAPDGDLSPFSNRKIARAAGWEGDPDAFVKALVECGNRGYGFLEPNGNGGYLLHSWDVYMEPLFREQVRNSQKQQRHRDRLKQDGVTGYVTGNVTGYVTPQDKIRIEENRTDEDEDEDEEKKETRIDETCHTSSTSSLSSSLSSPSLFPSTSDDVSYYSKPSRTKKLTRSEMPLEGVPCDPRAMGYISEMKELLPNYVPNEPVEMRFIQDMTLQYPEIDIVFEFSKAKNWIKNHLHDPKVRSRKLLLKFLTTWIEKAQEYKNERKAAELKAELEAQMPMFVPDDDEMSY